MAFCHGSGNLAGDGCCFVAGQVCALRWKIVDGRIKEGPQLVDRGTVAEYAASVTNNRQAQQRIIDQAQGVTFACKAAVEVVASDSKLLTDRAGFESAWAAHPAYQAVADQWEAIGMPRSYCPQFGPAEGQCCYAESESVNLAKCSALSASAVQIRQGRSR